MPASFGGSVVDPSLLRQAADRGVTICFADLEGADGLWVPEERTVLVNRRLPEDQVAEVIRHELGHVAIDDQHAELDAGRDVVGGPPARSRSWTAALGVAAMVAAVGGLTAGLTGGGGQDRQGEVGPNRVPTSDAVPSVQPTVTVIRSVGPDGRIVYRTVTVSPTLVPSLSPVATSASSVASTPAPTTPAPRTTAGRPTSAVPVPSTSPPVVTSPAPQPTPPPSADQSSPAPEPTTPAATVADNPGGTVGDVADTAANTAAGTVQNTVENTGGNTVVRTGVRAARNTATKPVLGAGPAASAAV